MKNTFLRACDALYMTCIWVAGLSILVMALIIPWGIFARYALGSGSSWPEPVAILLMALFTFVGAAASYRAGAHMAVTSLTDRLPKAWHGAITLLVELLMAAVCLFMLIWGVKLCMATWNQFLASLTSVRVGMAYSPIPIGGFVTLIFILERLLFGDQSGRQVINYEHVENSKEAA
jgi:TRAP-type C4-dicarboxylate transport system permease small subunit